MNIDLTKPIEILESYPGLQYARMGRRDDCGDLEFVGFTDICFAPAHLLTNSQVRVLAADRSRATHLFKELDAYRRLFENAPKMLALLKEASSPDGRACLGSKAYGFEAGQNMQRDVDALIKEIEGQ